MAAMNKSLARSNKSSHRAKATKKRRSPTGRQPRGGPGLRVPMVIVSPFAKKRFVDHTVYDTTIG